MMEQTQARKQIVLINGSAAEPSANQQLMDCFAVRTQDRFTWMPIVLKQLPPFDPGRTVENIPAAVTEMHRRITRADGVLICSPEYIFSIPSGLKNALEWCVASPVFSGKPTGIITASASGRKGHAELQLILKTLMARLSADTSLLIPGIRGKIDARGRLLDPEISVALDRFALAFEQLLRPLPEEPEMN